MEFVNAKNLDPCGTMEQEHGVIVLQDGKLKQMKLADLLNYVASASIESDKTLTLDGVAADAKVTGEEIGKRINKSGDTMIGELGMSGNRVTWLGAPVDAGDAANKGYVDGKRLTFTGTLAAGWWSDSAPYVQGVVISDIIDSDMPHITPLYSITNSTAIAQKEAWACVSNAYAGAGIIYFLCFEDKPATDIPIQIEVNR